MGLGVIPLTDTIQHAQPRWFGNVCRTDMVWQAQMQEGLEEDHGKPGKQRVQNMPKERRTANDQKRWYALYATSRPSGRRGSTK